MEAPFFDIAIIGAGIVGASIAWHLAPRARVVLLEAESAPGYHTTGRSAALFAEGYGPPAVRALTRASRAFFERPPEGFAPVPLLHRRGALFPGSPSQRVALEGLYRTLRDEGCDAHWLEADAVMARVPALRAEQVACGVLDAGASDIDVDALLQGFLRGARRAGAQLQTEARVTALMPLAAAGETGWLVTTAAGDTWRAGTLVNAAGAWLDAVAALVGAAPCGIEPRRRTAFVFDPPAGLDTRDWPAVVAADESWYIKPDAGLLLGSPANADPVPAHDVLPEELDVAIGIDRIQHATTLAIRRPRRAWAGLRSFVADGEPVCGFDPTAPGLFWAGAVGGYGIQSAPAFGSLCAALIAGTALPAELASLRLDLLAPRRPAHARP